MLAEFCKCLLYKDLSYFSCNWVQAWEFCHILRKGSNGASPCWWLLIRQIFLDTRIGDLFAEGVVARPLLFAIQNASRSIVK